MVILTTAVVALVIAVVYFGYSKKVTDNKLQDYIAKYESVKQYAETLTQDRVASTHVEPAPKTTTKQKAVKAEVVEKSTKKNAMPTPPTRRGRKPKTI